MQARLIGKDDRENVTAFLQRVSSDFQPSLSARKGGIEAIVNRAYGGMGGIVEENHQIIAFTYIMSEESHLEVYETAVADSHKKGPALYRLFDHLALSISYPNRSRVRTLAMESNKASRAVIEHAGFLPIKPIPHPDDPSKPAILYEAELGKLKSYFMGKIK